MAQGYTDVCKSEREPGRSPARRRRPLAVLISTLAGTDRVPDRLPNLY